MFCFACGSSELRTGDSTGQVTASISRAYPGSLSHVFCDVKKPLAQQSTPSLDETNYTTVIDAFRDALGCDAIRIYIDPSIADPSSYPPLYLSVLHYARGRGLRIYANPLNTGSFGMSDSSYASWVSAYANAFQPRFLGPFNEPGLPAARLEDIAQQVRAALNYPAVMVGPDGQKVEGSLNLLAQNPELAGSFDILGSHNAVDDQGATLDAWTQFAQFASGAAWSTENPRPWSFTSGSGEEVGIAAVVAAPIHALVLYEAFPSCVATDGSLTSKGAAISAGLGL